MSIYQLKSRFQDLLRPAVARLYAWGITANQVTVVACFISIALGLGLYGLTLPSCFFGLIPLWMLIRMALNAVDGMLARDYGQATPLGFFLNELTDVVSDAALYLPFILVLPGHGFWVGLVIVLAGLSEFAGAMGMVIGGNRRYDGPMGKSDRAFVFGLLGFVVATGLTMPAWLAFVMPLVALLIALTICRRIQAALIEGEGLLADTKHGDASQR